MADKDFQLGAWLEEPEMQEALRNLEIFTAFQGIFHKAHLEEARSILHKVLAARSFQVTPKLRARIDRQLHLGRLESWVVAAMSAGTIGEVFREQSTRRSGRARQRRRHRRA